MKFKIYEPAPWSSAYYFLKHNGPGLRCGIAISIYSEKLVWEYRSFLCGSNSNVVVFRSGLKHLLEKSQEKSVADKENQESSCITPEICSNESFSRRIRARQESPNSGLKSFHILSHTFRHSLNFHGIYFFCSELDSYLVLRTTIIRTINKVEMAHYIFTMNYLFPVLSSIQ